MPSVDSRPRQIGQLACAVGRCEADSRMYNTKATSQKFQTTNRKYYSEASISTAEQVLLSKIIELRGGAIYDIDIGLSCFALTLRTAFTYRSMWPCSQESNWAGADLDQTKHDGQLKGSLAHDVAPQHGTDERLVTCTYPRQIHSYVAPTHAHPWEIPSRLSFTRQPSTPSIGNSRTTSCIGGPDGKIGGHQSICLSRFHSERTVC